MDRETVEGYEPTPQQLRAWRQSRASVPPARARIEIRVTGPCDHDRLTAAVSQVVQRHEVFTTELREIRGLNRPLAVYAEQPLWSSDIVHRDGGCSVVLTGPGYAVDAWSLDPICRDMCSAYRGTLDREPEPLQYVDAAAWQAELAEGTGAPAMDFDGGQVGVGLPYRLVEDHDSVRVRRIPVAVPADVQTDLLALADRDDRTVEGVLAAAYSWLLSSIVGRQPALALSYPGRRHSELVGAVGPYAHYLPVGLDPDGNESFATLARRATADLAMTAQEQNTASWSPGRRLDEAIGQRLPFGLDVLNCSTVHSAGDTEFMIGGWQTFVDQCELRLVATRTVSGLSLVFEFDANQYASQDITHLADQFATLLAGCAASPDEMMAAHSMVSDAERQFVIRVPTVPADDPAHLGLGDGSALVDGRASAVWFDGAAVSAGEMGRRAAVLAAALGQSGGRSIGVLLDSPVDRAVAQLAILRRRAAYVPLDVAARPVVPELAAVVTTQDRVESVSGDTRTVLLDRLDSGAAEVETGGGDGDGLAYLIPGSDDDGPDVLLSYPAVLGRAVAMAAALGIGPDDRVLWGAPGVPCDGAFPYGLLVSLITGATLVCPPGTDFDDPRLWLDTVKASGATVWFSNTYAFETVTDLAARRSDRPLASLRLVVLRGTPPWSSLIDRMRSVNDDCTVEFVDGFAETGSYSFTSDPDRPPAGDRSTVATLSGQSAYILDEDLQPCAVGVGGLIAVGGEGVAVGYFGSAALTAERFVPDPYSERPGGRLFISTAAGWHRSDGRLEYVGSFNCAVERSDVLRAKQIDRQLFANPAVRQAITTAGPGEHGTVMTSYVVSDAPVEDLKADLAGRIPEHLLPILVRRPRLPLTTRGQVDVAALHPAGTPAPYVEPSGELEVRIARLCAELLGCERVSMTDNFFDLGGHSLLLARLAGLIDEELGVTVSLQELFEAVDLRAMADVVGNCET